MMAKRETVKEIMSDVKDARSVKKIANNTVRYMNEYGRMVIRFHHTDIITELPVGAVRIDSGGWMTPTTKNRLNEYLKDRNIGISQSNGKWYVMKWDGEKHTWTTIAPFIDGMTIHKDGTVPKEWLMKASAKDNKDERMKKKINNYLKVVKQKLESGDYLPSMGDCWFCSMYTEDTHIPLGDATNDHEHLMSHMNEGYVPGSMLWNAVKEAGYRPEVYLNPNFGKCYGEDFRSKVVIRATRKYLKRRCKLAV